MTRLRRHSAWGLGLVAFAGVLIALYLTATKLAGVAPICGPSAGCETVEASPYSSILGIPVGLIGAVFSAALVGLALAWGRFHDRRALYVAYGLGFAGTLVEVYLVYLELFVIHAICLWCAAYGVTVVSGWLLTIWAMRLQPQAEGDR